MKTFVRHAVTLLAITVLCQAGLALAENYYGDQTTAPAGVEKAAPAQGHSTCDPCAPAACGCEQSCESCDSCYCHLGCEEGCERLGIVGFAGLDSFKGIADGARQGNLGTVSGINVGLLLPGLGEYGFGWQTGLSYGLYDFDGRSSTFDDSARSQQQIFVTTGFFRKAKCDQRISFGLVYDWMLNEQWGEYGVHPTLGQWRGQVEYALSGCNAIGLWACVRDLGAWQRVPFSPGEFPNERYETVTNRAINQASLFWHHKFCSGADSYLWLGIPDRGRLFGDGSLFDWTVGASVQMPLTQRLALYANGAYYRPSGPAGGTAAIESGYDVGMGVVWYFGGGAQSHAINGKCAVPYMPVANNSNFLAEQNTTFP